MPATVFIVLGIFAAVALSTLATAHVRAAAAAALDEAGRRRIEAQLRRGEMLWRCVEWAGVLLICVSIYSKRGGYFLPVCGALLMCGAIVACAWRAREICVRETSANGTVTATATKAAWMVSAAEALLLAVLLLALTQNAAYVGVPVTEQDSADVDENKGLWLDETISLQELSWMNRMALSAAVNSGAVKTKSMAGKTLFRADDIERIKKQHAAGGK